MKKSIVVLQSSDGEALSCAENLANNFEVVGYTTDSEVALNLVAKEKPDFLITELVLRKSDGLWVIKKVKEISPSTKCVVVTVIAQGDLMQNAIDYGVAYYMVKPVNYLALNETLKDIAERASLSTKAVIKGEKDFGEKTIDEKISRIFIGIGIPPHIKGYVYLREGVKLAVLSPDIINSITKKLYPTIGKKFNTSASKVERAIRHAIEVAWNRGRIESFNALFGVRVYGENEKPTNSEFIALIADRLLLDGIS